MALDGTNQYNVRNTTVPSPCKSLGTDKCAIAEMRGPIRALGQGSQPGDNGANDLSSLIEQNTLRLDGSHANRCASALKSGELPLDVLTASNIAFDFTENSSEVAEGLRQVTQTDRVTLEGDGQRIRHLADSFVGASAGLTGPGQARRGGDHERTEEGEPSQRASGARKQGPHASSWKRPGSSRYLRVAASSATSPSAARPATEDKANEAGIARDYRAVSRRTTRKRFATDLRNLTLASPQVNRHQKSGRDAGEWVTERNRCWSAGGVHKLGEMGRQGDVTAMSARHVPSSSRLSDGTTLAEGVKV